MIPFKKHGLLTIKMCSRNLINQLIILKKAMLKTFRRFKNKETRLPLLWQKEMRFKHPLKST